MFSLNLAVGQAAATANWYTAAELIPALGRPGTMNGAAGAAGWHYGPKALTALRAHRRARKLMRVRFGDGLRAPLWASTSAQKQFKPGVCGTKLLPRRSWSTLVTGWSLATDGVAPSVAYCDLRPSCSPTCAGHPAFVERLLATPCT